MFLQLKCWVELYGIKNELAMPSQYRCDVAFELKIGKSGGTNLTQRYERRTSSHISSFSSGVYPSTGICFYNTLLYHLFLIWGSTSKGWWFRTNLDFCRRRRARKPWRAWWETGHHGQPLKLTLWIFYICQKNDALEVATGKSWVCLLFNER